MISDKSRGTGRPLSLGLMCNGLNLEKWQVHCLKLLLKSGFVSIKLVIIDDGIKTVSTISKLKNVLQRPGRALYYFYVQFIGRPHSTSMVDMNAIFNNVEQIHCKPVYDGEFSQHLNDSDCELIARYNLDVILKFGFGAIQGKVLKAARHGIWSFLYSDREMFRGSPGSFQDVFNNSDVTQCALLRLEDSLYGGTVLKKGFLATYKYSYPGNTDQLNYEIAKWPAQLCRDIYYDNAGYFNHAARMEAPVYDPPGNAQMLRFMFRIIKNTAVQIWQMLYKDQWNIGVISEPIQNFLLPGDWSKQIHWAPAPSKNRFLADPFGKVDGTAITILCEEFDGRKGVISTIEFTAEKNFSKSFTVIRANYHMSYPCLIPYEDEIYCVAETYEAGSIDLYKAEEFPCKWVKLSTLIPDIAGVDPTVFQYGNLWWLMHTDEGQGPDLNLFAWYATSLTGPWEPHLRNPIKTDVRSSRPGGTPFIHNGHLYRPSQDCSRTYGGRISLNRVLILTPEDFAEEFVWYIEPSPASPFPNGLHTLSSAGNFTLIDGKRPVFTHSRVIKKIKGLLKPDKKKTV